MQRVINSVELAEPARRVKLACLGEWRGHPQVGTQLVTPERAQSIADQFAAHYAANGAQLVIDYNHATILALAGRCAPDQAKASGWVGKIEMQDGEPWGEVEWTANAEALIRAREFRYLSPVFEFDVPDRVTGQIIPARLHSVALTNKPFLTELPAVANVADAIAALNASGPSQEIPDMELTKLNKALGIAEGATEAQAEARIAELVKRPETAPLLAANAADVLGVPHDASLEVVTARVKALSTPTTENRKPTTAFEHVAVANAVGLESAASLDDVLAKIGELRGAVVNSDAELLVGKAVADGKVPPADKGHWIEQAKRDLAQTEKMIANMAALVGRRATATAPADAALPELTESEIEVARLTGVDLKKLRESKKA